MGIYSTQIPCLSLTVACAVLVGGADELEEDVG